MANLVITPKPTISSNHDITIINKQLFPTVTYGKSTSSIFVRTYIHIILVHQMYTVHKVDDKFEYAVHSQSCR